MRLLQRLNTPTARFALRVGALLGLVGGAYHYSLITLLNGVSLQTPLAYLGLVPLVALFLVVGTTTFGKGLVQTLFQFPCSWSLWRLWWSFR